MSWRWLTALFVFVAYAIRFAPPDDPAMTRALVHGVFTGQFGSVDPAIAAVFAMLGVVPLLACAFVLRDGAQRRLPAAPFALAMFVVGGFALLTWLALRGLGGPRAEPRPPGIVLRFLARRSVAWALCAALAALSVWGLVAGSAAAYARAFHTASMVHVMSIDLVVCTGLLAVLVEEARARMLDPESPMARVVRFVPLFGAAVWNALQ